MKLKLFGKKVSFITVLIVILISICIGGIATMFATPGDADDPVVTLSYIQNEIMPKVQNSFKVVNVAQGKSLIGKGGTEIVLRMGKATIIATEKGGLADLTSGVDLGNGANMPANSHLVVPMDDNRGILAKTDVILLVKGDYEVK